MPKLKLNKEASRDVKFASHSPQQGGGWELEKEVTVGGRVDSKPSWLEDVLGNNSLHADLVKAYLVCVAWNEAAALM